MKTICGIKYITPETLSKNPKLQIGSYTTYPIGFSIVDFVRCFALLRQHMYAYVPEKYWGYITLLVSHHHGRMPKLYTNYISWKCGPIKGEV